MGRLAAAEVEDGGSDRLGARLPLRRLGETGEAVTLLGVGGWHVGHAEAREVPAIIEAALEGGIRFFDTAWQYQEGRSEQRYGQYLVPRYRDDVFLMTKIIAGSAAEARGQLEACLQRLRTDHVDLLLMHGVGSRPSLSRRLTGGVLEVLLDARERGLTRYLGFSGHASPGALLEVFERLGDTNPLQVCLLPVNVVDAGRDDGFTARVMPELVRRRCGVVGMKSLAFGHFFATNSSDGHRDSDPIIPNYLSVEEALWFALSLPTGSLLSGMDREALVRENVGIAKRFSALSVDDRRGLIDRVSGVVGRAGLEGYR